MIRHQSTPSIFFPQAFCWKSFRTMIKSPFGDSPGGTVVESPPINSGTSLGSLITEDPSCRRATKPTCHNYSRAQETRPLSPHAATAEAHAHAPQQAAKRAAAQLEGSPHSPPRALVHSHKDPAQAKIKQNKILIRLILICWNFINGLWDNWNN